LWESSLDFCQLEYQTSDIHRSTQELLCLLWTNTDALVSSLAKEGALGQTIGIAGSFKEFGDMVGPLLIGVLSQFLGLTTGFVICGVLGLIAFGFIMRKSKTT